MGFYGNITNTSKTTFQFDKVYPNRLSMDANVNNDGIFIGRYVLVEYDQDAAYPIIYTEDGVNFYSSPNITEEMSRIKFKSGKRPVSETQSEDVFYLGEIGQVQDIEYNPDKTIKSIEINFYQCSNNEDDQDGVDAIFSLLTKTSSNNTYINNFAIDEAYESWNEKFKGYDSTVWVKTTINTDDGLITKYVNIADLNSVVPTFDIAADAPTMTPITPHFDADSTNVYYKLHAQPQWGFRIAKADGNTETQYTSDADTQWTKIDYNTSTDETSTLYASGVDGNKVPIWEGDSNSTLPAAIFYNARAFEKQIGETSIDKHSQDITEDKIEITSGKSGNQYNLHNGGQGPSKGVQDDTQELTIHLPSIGNMMSDAWDIIHGPNRDDARTDENSSLQGRLDSFEEIKKNQIPVKRMSDGTLVGSKINNAKNYTLPENKDILSADNIPDKYKGDDPWIETLINTESLKGGQKLGENGVPEGEYDQSDNSGISIRHTFHKVKDSSTSLDKNTGKFEDTSIADEELLQENKLPITNRSTSANDTIKLYTPYVDAAGHVVGKNIETITLPYGYKTITTNGLANDEVSNDLDNSIGRKTEASKTQDSFAINTKNKWLQIEITEDKVELAHEIHDIPNNLDNASTKDKDDNLNKRDDNTKNLINIPDFTQDNAGHITSISNHIYTLPYGYKTIAVNNSTAATAAPVSTDGKTQMADNTQDTIQFNASNKWIKLEAETEDTIKFGHILSPIAPNEAQELNKNSILHQSSDYNIASFGDSFNILNFTTDNAGHIIAVSEDTITIPKGRLDDTISTNASNVLTSIGFESSTGIITTTHENVGTLKLTGYNNNTADNFKIQATDTINSAFATTQNYINDLNLKSSKTDTDWIVDVKQVNGQISVERAGTNSLKLNNYDAQGQGTDRVANEDIINIAIAKLQNQIIAEENARAAAINALDVTDTIDNTQYVSGVSEADGKITVSRGGTNTLQISNYNSDSTDSKKIYDGNTINGAFKKLEDRIMAEENNRKNAIDTLYGNNGEKIAETFDTIKEIADFLEQDADNGVQSGVETIINRIGSLETKVGNSSVNDQISSEINKLNKTDSAVNNQYVSAVSESNGIITVTRADLPTYTLTSGTTDGTVKFNGNDVAVTGLGSAAYTDSSAYATAEQGNLANSAIQPTTEFIYQEEIAETDEETGETIIIQSEEKITIDGLIAKIKDLEAEILLLKGYHSSEV